MLAMRYNLFRNRDREDLCCAVPEDKPVPAFVTDQGWTFAGPVGGQKRPRGFDGRAADEGARLNGFYVFQEVRPTMRGPGRASP
jgi:hypothetical protein